MSKTLGGVGAAGQQIECSNRDSSKQEPAGDWHVRQPTDGSPAGPGLQVMQVTLGRSDSSSGKKSRETAGIRRCAASCGTRLLGRCVVICRISHARPGDVEICNPSTRTPRGGLLVRFRAPQSTSHNALRPEIPTRSQAPRFVELLNRRSAPKSISISHDPGELWRGQSGVSRRFETCPTSVNPTWTKFGIPKTANLHLREKRREQCIRARVTGYIQYQEICKSAYCHRTLISEAELDFAVVNNCVS
jgi:hypothetical protein